MTLQQFLSWYLSVHDLSEGYENQLESAVRLFCQSVGVVPLEQVTAAHVNTYLKALRKNGRSDSYIKNRRTHLLVLLREAHRRAKVPELNLDDVLRVRVSDRITRGYTAAAMQRIIDAAWDLPAYRPYYLPNSRLIRRDWWVAFLMARWDTGCDTDTLLSIERSWIPPHRSLTVIRPKTRKRVRIFLHASTLEAIDRCMQSGGERRFIWPLTYSRKSLDKEFSVIRKRAEVPGSLKWTRAGSGTSVELRHPGRGHEHLGNTRQVFERHYLIEDRVLSEQSPRLPEPLLLRQLSQGGHNKGQHGKQGGAA